MDAPPLTGQILDDRYRVEQPLGEGGVGVVYRATHVKLGRPVALKVLQPEYVNVEVLRHRFDREAKALAALVHPNIVAVTDYGIAGGVPYLVMELLEGEGLDTVLARERIEPGRALTILLQVLGALAFAHERGVLHRDLKPGNVFLQRVGGGRELPKILDFGLAKFVTGDEAAPRSGPALTKSGAIFGTPAYMSPEQATGSKTDPRTDVYACGVMLFEMITGKRPFEGNQSELLRQHLLVPPARLGEVLPEMEIAAELQQILDRALAKEVAKRYADAGAMRAAVEALPPEPVRKRPPASTVATSAATLPTMAAAAPGEDATTTVTTEGGRTKLVVLAAAGLAVVGAAAAACLIASALLGGGDEPEPPPRTLTPPPTPTPVPARPPTLSPIPPQTPTPRPAPAPSGDLWAGASTELRALYDKVRRGDRVSNAERSRLFGMALSDRDDPRPQIVLAYHYANFGARSDAIVRYQKAYAANPSARSDPRMRSDLEAFASHRDRAVAHAARRALREIYGSSPP